MKVWAQKNKWLNQWQEWVWVAPGTCFQCLKVLFQDVFLSLLNMVLPTKKCSPQGLRQMDLDCEGSQKAVLIIQNDEGLFLSQNIPVARRAPGCVKGAMSVSGDAHPCPPLSQGFGRGLLHLFSAVEKVYCPLSGSGWMTHTSRWSLS